MVNENTVGSTCEITTGKLDSNAEVIGGGFPFYTCAKEPTTIDNYAYDDDVVLVAGNNAKGNFHVNRYNGKFNAYQRTYILKSKGSISIDYVYYVLKLTLKILKDKSQGSQTKFLTKGILENIQIPKISNSKQIAKVLSDLDAKIEVNNKINQQLEALAKTIYDYWFVQFDFPDANGKPYKSSGGKMVYNEELKREIPKGWEDKELKEIADCIMGQSPKGETYNQDGVGMPLLNGPADYENGSLKARTYTTDPKRTCQKDDLVLCIRATIGNLVYSEDEFCLGRGVAAVRTKKEKLSELVYYLLLQEIERFKVHATGSIIKGITKEDLTNSMCLIPSENHINAFHNQINPIFDKIRINKKENQKLAALRDWLLPMLMNGQVTVGEAKEQLGMVAEDSENYKNG